MLGVVVILALLAAILMSRSKKMADPARARTVSRIAIALAVAALLVALLDAANMIQDHGEDEPAALV